MKIFFDLFPVLIFFITLKFAQAHQPAAQELVESFLLYLGQTQLMAKESVPILLATLAVIVASFVQIITAKLYFKKIDPMLWISTLLVLIMGGLTLYLQDDRFIKWKPTLLYWLFAICLIGAKVLFQKNFIQTILGKEIELPQAKWAQLNVAWSLFFALMGLLNLYIAFNYSIDTWASFKLFGFLGLTFLFVIAQTFWLQKHIGEKK